MWKYIFNTQQHRIMWRDREAAARAAIDAGYRFFSWNGEILFIAAMDGISIHDTGITIEEMEHGFVTQY